MTISGGYFLTRAVERPPYVAASLLPSRILSISECICQFVPDSWAIEWMNVEAQARAAEATERGLSPAVQSEVISWTTQKLADGDFGYPNVFFSARDARLFAGRFMAGAADLRLLGIGLHPDSVEGFLSSEQPGPGEGASGIYDATSSGAELERGGTDLGWEVLCYDHGGFHSWLCNGLEKDIARDLGIKPSSTGFLADPVQAVAAAEYCGREDVGGEPGFWAPWLVVEYPLTE